MTIFVTGATGFIGQRLLVRLKEKGTKLKILSRNPQPDYETVVCDLQHEAIPGNSLQAVDTVFHLAGYTHDLRETTEIEHLYRQVNVDSTDRLAKLAVASGVKSFVFVSSVKAGGRDEADVNPKPEGVYGQTKREAELRLLEIGRLSQMHVSIVRPSLVYGAGAKGNLALMRKGIEQRWFPPLPETGNRRSMIHVDDLVDALFSVTKDDRANGEIFIATDGVPHSSREIFEGICKAVGRKVPAWSVPKFIFEGLALLNPRIGYKVDKLLGDDYYSSEKLENLGYRAKNSLIDIDS